MIGENGTPETPDWSPPKPPPVEPTIPPNITLGSE